MATKKTEKVVETEEVIETKVEKNEEPTSDMVEVELFLDSERYSDDVQVGVNGMIYTVQRGKKVKVPRPVAEIIWHQKAQDSRTSALINKYENKFKADTARYTR